MQQDSVFSNHDGMICHPNNSDDDDDNDSNENTPDTDASASTSKSEVIAQKKEAKKNLKVTIYCK